MMLSLTLLYESIPEFKTCHCKAQALHKLLRCFNKRNVSLDEFYSILRTIKQEIEKIDSYYFNYRSTEIDAYFFMPSGIHIIEFTSLSYESTLIAKQF